MAGAPRAAVRILARSIALARPKLQGTAARDRRGAERPAARAGRGGAPLAAALFPSVERLPEPLARRARGVLGEIGEQLVERLRTIVRGAVTEELMTLALPDGTLRLGRDLTGAFPAQLSALTDPELLDFLRAVDPTADTLRGSGADDWARLPQRMHFIADLFRLQHDNAALFQPPFTPDQLRSIAADRTPDGQL